LHLTRELSRTKHTKTAWGPEASGHVPIAAWCDVANRHGSGLVSAQSPARVRRKSSHRLDAIAS
jgi:hypothetical protein